MLNGTPLYNRIINKEHHAYRHTVDWQLAEQYAANQLSPIERMADRFERLCKEEKVVILEGEQIVFLRTVANLPDIFTEEEWKARGANIIIYANQLMRAQVPAMQKAASRVRRPSLQDRVSHPRSHSRQLEAGVPPHSCLQL